MDKVGRIEFGGNLKESIRQAVDKIGGFKQFVKPGEVVMLKPNFNTPDPFPGSSDLEFLKAVVELVYECGAKLVMIGESATMTMNTRKVMERLGVFDLLNLPQPPRIYNFDEGEWVKREIPEAKFLKSVSIPKILERPDKLIFLPCLKTHKYAQYTGALKLAVGLMKPQERVSLHMWHLQEKIAELNKIIHPDLVIMDARKCFINRGPAQGELREPNLILASTDRVAIDVEGVKIIRSFKGNSLHGVDPWELLQVKWAKKIGAES